ncbi:MAG: transglutaminase domain-containing protein [Oscillospiraceae bacterium]
MKKIISNILIIAIALSVIVFSTGVSASTLGAKESANALYRLGLFKGVGTNANGTPDYDLTGTANRETAATMLVRIIGKENEAAAVSCSCPFNDVSAWANNYVAWARNNGYINGYSSTSFGGTDKITAQQYITMVLRVLGYSDSGSDGDFTYQTACSFAASIGLTDGSYTNSTRSFTRGDIAKISYSALNTPVKGSSRTLYDVYHSGEPVPMASSADTSYINTASGTSVAQSSDNKTVIDYSNCSDGYVMVKTTQSGTPKLVVMITGPSGASYKYYYTSSSGVFEAFPLTEGSGSYKIGVYKNTSGTKYSTLYSKTIDVTINDELSPFLRPNFFVNYDDTTKVVEYAGKLCSGVTDELEKVSKIYEYVVGSYTYDYDKAESVQTGYRPVLDTVYSSKKGICFDYAAVMAAMLRSQNVPTKLVVGYAGTAYHAWISVYTEESGWIEAVIYFNGSSWKLMDPTFASTGGSSSSIMSFINDSSNYSAKYVY